VQAGNQTQNLWLCRLTKQIIPQNLLVSLIQCDETLKKSYFSVLLAVSTTTSRSEAQLHSVFNSKSPIFSSNQASESGRRLV
jgi:hypothetical protein